MCKQITTGRVPVNSSHGQLVILKKLLLGLGFLELAYLSCNALSVTSSPWCDELIWTTPAQPSALPNPSTDRWGAVVYIPVYKIKSQQITQLSEVVRLCHCSNNRSPLWRRLADKQSDKFNQYCCIKTINTQPDNKNNLKTYRLLISRHGIFKCCLLTSRD